MKVKVKDEIIDINIETHSEEISVDAQIQELKQKLADTDYVACKIAEGVATYEEYADIIAERQVWRNEINRLSKG